MKTLMSVVAVVSVLLGYLNLLGDIVSGIWLAIIGDWKIIGLGIVLFFISTWSLSFALIPSVLLGAPAAYFVEKGKMIPVVFFALLSNLYTYALVTIWCCGILFLFVHDASPGNIIPRLLWSYGAATGPWAYMAAKEQGQDDEGFASLIVAFLTQLAFLVIMLVVLFTTITLLDAIILFGCFMSVGLIGQVILLVVIMKESKEVALY